MELSAEQQERYARHLLLEGVEGPGQERLCAAQVQVRGEGLAALWAARYLAASGVGALVVDTENIASECRLLNGDASVSLSLGSATCELILHLGQGGPLEGAQAALAAFRALGTGR